MKSRWRIRLGVLLLGMIALMGCNPILLTAYLFSNGDPKRPPEYALKATGNKKEVRVVVLTSSRPGMTDFIGIDQMLGAEFIRVLDAMCEENKENSREKVTILKMHPLQKYKEEHPDWRSHHPVDIGKHFGADYVIDLEILNIGMYEPNAYNKLLRGRASIAVTAYDLSKPLKEPAYQIEYNPVFPRAREVDISEETPSSFRKRFVQSMAQEIAIKFVPHTSKQAIPVN